MVKEYKLKVVYHRKLLILISVCVLSWIVRKFHTELIKMYGLEVGHLEVDHVYLSALKSFCFFIIILIVVCIETSALNLQCLLLNYPFFYFYQFYFVSDIGFWHLQFLYVFSFLLLYHTFVTKYRTTADFFAVFIQEFTLFCLETTCHVFWNELVMPLACFFRFSS